MTLTARHVARLRPQATARMLLRRGAAQAREIRRTSRESSAHFSELTDNVDPVTRSLCSLNALMHAVVRIHDAMDRQPAMTHPIYLHTLTILADDMDQHLRTLHGH